MPHHQGGHLLTPILRQMRGTRHLLPRNSRVNSARPPVRAVVTGQGLQDRHSPALSHAFPDLWPLSAPRATGQPVTSLYAGNGIPAFSRFYIRLCFLKRLGDRQKHFIHVLKVGHNYYITWTFWNHTSLFSFHAICFSGDCLNFCAHDLSYRE